MYTKEKSIRLNSDKQASNFKKMLCPLSCRHFRQTPQHLIYFKTSNYKKTN